MFSTGGKEELAEMAEIMARTQAAAIVQVPINLELSITIHRHPRQDVENDLSDEMQTDDEPDFYDEDDPEFN